MATSQRAETITPLEVGRRLPSFRLPLTTGGLLTPSAYRGRANLAVFVLPAADELAAAVLRGVSERFSDYQERHAQPLAIVGGPIEAVNELQRRLALPYPSRRPTRTAKSSPGWRRAPLTVVRRRWRCSLTATPNFALRRSAGRPACRRVRPTSSNGWMYVDCLCSCRGFVSRKSSTAVLRCCWRNVRCSASHQAVDGARRADAERRVVERGTPVSQAAAWTRCVQRCPVDGPAPPRRRAPDTRRPGAP